MRCLWGAGRGQEASGAEGEGRGRTMFSQHASPFGTLSVSSSSGIRVPGGILGYTFYLFCPGTSFLLFRSAHALFSCFPDPQSGRHRVFSGSPSLGACALENASYCRRRGGGGTGPCRVWRNRLGSVVPAAPQLPRRDGAPAAGQLAVRPGVCPRPAPFSPPGAAVHFLPLARVSVLSASPALPRLAHPPVQVPGGRGAVGRGSF